ncbi:MAG: hypothetical protein B6229_02755 [Spirochaetaceae bacterium 4572_7]|nr:MAG: hypothetical protein B6229_02755 [Spirochaetaceae bacterium 4572_7]
MTIENIKKRNKITKTVKEFFDSKNYLELETPILSPTLIPESSLEIFSTTNTHPYKKNRTSYLVPSPEIWLKKFLSENPVNIYEISKCFRNSEQYGKQHNPEFTMLEYYTMNYNYLDTLKLTKQLIDYINKELTWSKLPKKSLVMSMENAFIAYAGFSLKDNYTIKLLHKRATELNIHTSDNDNWETAFNRIFIDIVEPNLPKNVNLFLTDFPSKIMK